MWLISAVQTKPFLCNLSLLHCFIFLPPRLRHDNVRNRKDEAWERSSDHRESQSCLVTPRGRTMTQECQKSCVCGNLGGLEVRCWVRHWAWLVGPPAPVTLDLWHWRDRATASFTVWPHVAGGYHELIATAALPPGSVHRTTKTPEWFTSRAAGVGCHENLVQTHSWFPDGAC